MVIQMESCYINIYPRGSTTRQNDVARWKIKMKDPAPSAVSPDSQRAKLMQTVKATVHPDVGI